MKRLLILFLLILVAPSAFAEQSVALSPISFQVSAVNALSKFEQTVLYPEGLLKRYQPAGAQISNKRVSQNVISFVATKTKFFITKTVRVGGVLESGPDNRACSNEDIGYSLRMQFDSSDVLITDNVQSLEAIVCLRSKSDNELVGNVRSKIILGNNYSKIVGPIVIDLIKEQVSPLLNALTEEIKMLR